MATLIVGQLFIVDSMQQSTRRLVMTLLLYAHLIRDAFEMFEIDHQVSGFLYAWEVYKCNAPSLCWRVGECVLIEPKLEQSIKQMKGIVYLNCC